MNEAETRAEHIDPALKAAGWGVVEGSRVLREHGITLGRLQGGGKRAKAEIADYVLVYPSDLAIEWSRDFAVARLLTRKRMEQAHAKGVASRAL